MRNIESRFSLNPTTENISRSTFEQHWTVTTAFDAGKLIPIDVQEVLPGDTFSMDTSVVCRMSTPIYPVMDEAYIDIYHFFVPNRLVWDKWKNLMGENTTGAWYDETADVQVPQFTYTTSYNNTFADTNLDYLGLPVGLNGNSETLNFNRPISASVNILPLRGLRLIWNEWFRDQNVSAPKLVNKGDSATQDELDTLPDLYPVAKFHDYFTSVLPAPQKGPSVPLPLTGDAPVITGDVFSRSGIGAGSWVPMEWKVLGNPYMPLAEEYSLLGRNRGTPTGDQLTSVVDLSNPAPEGDGADVRYYVPNNLYASLGNVTAATINQLRQAFQVQKLYERDARGGTRYIEQIYSHFGVVSPDARMQRPEYLGGERINIAMQQVVQNNAGGDGVTPLGTTSAFSFTRSQDNSYTKSFTEHGFVFCLACVRTHNTYQQGINRMWSRRDRLDYYYPVFANLGEQAVLNKEIYATGGDSDDEVFGYQEAWAEYRYTPSRVTGAFRSNYFGGSLDSWTYASWFNSMPYYSEDFIYSGAENVARTLAVLPEDGSGRDTGSKQFLANFSFRNTATRKMPLYSIPGLIDHH